MTWTTSVRLQDKGVENGQGRPSPVVRRARTAKFGPDGAGDFRAS